MKAFLNSMRPHNGNPVVSGHTGGNAELIAEVARLYIPEDAHVWDFTYGKGVFWKGIKERWFFLEGSDLVDYDYNEITTPDLWSNESYHRSVPDDPDDPYTADVVVFDPPYKSGGATSHASMVDRYGLANIETDTKSKHGNWRAVYGEYVAGISKAKDVLVDNGVLMVKCQDMVESGRQVWMHTNVLTLAESHGFYPRDLFVLQSTKKPMMRHDGQKHSRKNVSYLWVFEKR